jgi:hypothetical protein
MFAAIQQLHYGRLSLSWPKVIGEVTEVRKREYKSQSGSKRHYYEMKYTYVVNHVTWEGNRYSFKAMHPDLVFSVGAATVIYYNPKNPKQSVIIPGISLNNFMFVGISIVITIIGIVVLVRHG